MNNLLHSTPGFYIATFAFLGGFFIARLYYKKYIIKQLTKEIENYSLRIKRQEIEKNSNLSTKVVNIETYTRYKKKYH